jgi:hypothetical protein
MAARVDMNNPQKGGDPEKTKNGLEWPLRMKWPGMAWNGEEWDNALRNGLLTSPGCRRPLLSVTGVALPEWT